MKKTANDEGDPLTQAYVTKMKPANRTLYSYPEMLAFRVLLIRAAVAEYQEACYLHNVHLEQG
jgi:hypothetical protein